MKNWFGRCLIAGAAALAVFGPASVQASRSGWGAPLAALLLQRSDLGTGYVAEFPTHCVNTIASIVTEGPNPGTMRTVRQHGYVQECSAGFRTRAKVTFKNGRMYAGEVLDWGEVFTSANGAHWGFTQARRHVSARIPFATVGNEAVAYRATQMGTGMPAVGVIFRRGKYLGSIIVYHTPPSPPALAALARTQAGRFAKRG